MKKSNKTLLKRRQMVQEVFKKVKKQREIAKKFDEKIAQRQGYRQKADKYKVIKQNKKKESISNRDQIVELDKKLNEIRQSLMS